MFYTFYYFSITLLKVFREILNFISLVSSGEICWLHSLTMKYGFRLFKNDKRFNLVKILGFSSIFNIVVTLRIFILIYFIFNILY